MLKHLKISLFFLLLVHSITAFGTEQDPSWTYNMVNDYCIVPNIVYAIIDGFDCKLDVYARNNSDGPTPTVIGIHGGGWLGGTKELHLGHLMPYFEMGLSIVNINYRVTENALAPAAVQDCRLALRWVFRNAKAYGFDTTKLIITGISAGGHLALMTGMLDNSYGLNMPMDPKYNDTQPKVAAIINWLGPTDLIDLISGPNKKDYAMWWLGDQKDRESIARSVSPLNYVRKGLPPIFTVHGDKDEQVPYSQAVRLHDALTKVGVPNQLMTIVDGKHPGYTKEGRYYLFTKGEMISIYTAIKVFMKTNGLL